MESVDSSCIFWPLLHQHVGASLPVIPGFIQFGMQKGKTESTRFRFSSPSVPSVDQNDPDKASTFGLKTQGQ